MDGKTAAALRGNERIQQLTEEFPEIPRIMVIKGDLIQQGIKPSPATRMVGRWALPDAHDYFEFDKEDTHTPEEVAEGYTLTPVVAHFDEEISYRFMFDSRSPYEIRYEERGRYRLYRDGDPLEEVYFPPRPEWYSKKTSTGKPMSSIIALRAEACMKVVPTNYCEYFKDDKGCRYCNMDSAEATKKDLGMDRVVAKREEDIYETFVAASQEGKMRHVSVSGGVILNSSKEADMYARVARALKRAMKDVGNECSISVKCQAMEREDQLKLKEAGVNSIGFNLEVWDEKLFPIICPGKAKYVGRERWIDRLLQAVDIWGSTNSSFVLGVEMAPPYGFKTEDEAAESVMQGWEWLADRGIFPGGNPWRPAPGTIFAGLPSPRTEYVLRMELARYKLLQKHSMVRKRCNRCWGQNLFGDWAWVDSPRSS